MLNPLYEKVTLAVNSINTVEGPEAKRAMTRTVGKNCLDSVNELFNILNGKVETC
jgi:hypothetical protein